jgi:hypothetical protein
MLNPEPIGVFNFIIDMNNIGELFRLSILGKQSEIQSYLYQYSNDVRYCPSRILHPVPHRNDKGVRKLPCGLIVNCRFERDKYLKFGKRETKLVDERQVFLSE